MTRADIFFRTTPPEALFGKSKTWLTENYPELCGGLLFNQTITNPELMICAHSVMERYGRLIESSGNTLESGLDKFCQLTFDFLRLQTRFMKTGKYRSSSAQKLACEIYDDPAKMEGYYLDGLLLTYALWPNHVHMLRFFMRDFVGGLSENDKLVEVGVGHGLMACLALGLLPKVRYTGIDISRSSIDFTRKIFQTNGIPAEQVTLLHQDATKIRNDMATDAEAWDAAMCCEILEHVEDPTSVMDLMRDLVRAGGRIYVTTVANIEAEDHIFLFHDVDQIRDLFRQTGFRIEKELCMPLKGMETASPLPVNYAGILTRL